jgi:uncharacterized protein (DUF2384 family)
MTAAAVLDPLTVLSDSGRASGPALRAFERIGNRWGLSQKERYTLLGLPRSTYFTAKRGTGSARFSRDTLERISYVLGIYSALKILLPRREAADAWIRTPNGNSLFKGRPPIEMMLGGKVGDLFVVRRYLDGERGW